MEATYKRRLELLITLLVVGIVVGAAIIVLGAENAVPGTNNNGYIRVVSRHRRRNRQSNGPNSMRDIKRARKASL